MHTDSLDRDELAKDFAPDKERAGYKPRAREKRVRELQHGMSAFASEQAARDEWAKRRKWADGRGEAEVLVGNYIAEVELIADEGFEIEELPEEADEGHLTIWGDRRKLAAAVRRPPYLATRNET